MQTIWKHTSPDDLMQEFTELLSEKMGLYYPKERWNDLEKKLFPLMRSLGFKDVAPCIEWLRDNLSHEKHIAELAYHLTIGETYFFRDSRLFSTLEKQILPAMIQRRQNARTLSIWSAGCCSGEETYSLAILLHRLLPDIQKWDIRLIGSDINQEFLRKAELGRYHRWSFRSTPEKILATYFEKRSDGAFYIRPEIQQLVSFRCANLVDEDRPEISYFRNEMDLVICNNVLIYFSQKQIDKTINRLVQALVKEGWLTVTPVEAPFVSHPQLVQASIPDAIFFQKSSGTNDHLAKKPLAGVPGQNGVLLQLVLPAFLKSPEPVPPPQIIQETTPPTTTSADETDVEALYLAKRYGDVIAQLIPELTSLRSNPEALASRIANLICLIRTYSNRGDADLALEWCEIALRADPLNPVIQYLKAEIRAMVNDVVGAIDALHKALFIDPEFLAALYLYGQLEQKRGQTASATKAFNRVLTLIDTYPQDEPLPGTEELLASQVKNHLLHSARRDA